MRFSEWVVVGYFAYLSALALGAPFRSAPAATLRRVRVILESGITVAAAIWLADADSGTGLLVRNWAPAAYLLAMYWVPAHLVTGAHRGLEDLLVGLDRRLVGGGGDRALPRWLIEGLELSYLLCYPLIPLGMALLSLAGAQAEADRYWTAVLLAGAVSYGCLPWLATRPPRETLGPPRPSLVGRLNMHVVRSASVHWNTFPSGHVATALAATLVVATVWPAAGIGLAVVTVGISVGAFVGRYHYLADIAAGLVVAFLAFNIS
jgi:membrane-associated phospholipid phosphatase